MKSQFEEVAWLKGMRKKIEEEMIKKEVETIVYWKGELEKIVAKKPESLGTFQMDLQNFIRRLQNRVKVLKSSLQS